MEWVHCNACGSMPHMGGLVEQKRYFITSCGHLTCASCVRQSPDRCLHCNSSCNTVELNQHTPSDVKNYFADPMAPIQDLFKKAGKVVAFQKAQVKLYSGWMAKLSMAFQKERAEKVELQRQIAAAHEKIAELQKRHQEQENWIRAGMASRDENRANTPIPIFPQPRTTPPMQESFSINQMFTPRRTSNSSITSGSMQGSMIRNIETPSSVASSRFTIRTPTSAITPNLNDSYSSCSGTISPSPAASRFAFLTRDSGNNNPHQNMMQRLRNLRCSASPVQLPK